MKRHYDDSRRPLNLLYATGVQSSDGQPALAESLHNSALPLDIFLGSAAATTDVFHSNKSVRSSSTVWVYWQHDYLILASWIRRKSIVGNVLHVIETLLSKGENRGCGTRNA